MTASTNQSSFRISSGWGESCLSRYSTTRQFTSSGTTPSSFRYPFRQKSIICRSLRVGLQSYVAPVKSSPLFFQKKLPFHSAVFPFKPHQAPSKQLTIRHSSLPKQSDRVNRQDPPVRSRLCRCQRCTCPPRGTQDR